MSAATLRAYNLVMWKVWLVFLLGLWVFISAFVPGAVAHGGHSIFFGALIAGFSAWAAPARRLEWINLALGVWFLVSGFFLHNLWNNLAVGLIVAVISLIDGVAGEPEGSGERKDQPTHEA